tara:strand:- start:993 stop:2225 length:1233 start_codon:yes stop_codon:yes gene_type:complete
MKVKESFDKLIDIISSSKVIFDDGYYRIFDIEDLDRKTVEQLLKDIGYSVQAGRTVKETEILINTNVTAWGEGKCPLFSSWEILFNEVSASYAVPENFYIVDEGQTDTSIENNKGKLELFCGFRRLLADIADHCEPKTGPGKGTQNVLFLIEVESNVKRYEFSPSITWAQLKAMGAADDGLFALDKLKQSIALEDSQDIERRSSLRSALNEMAGSCTVDRDIFPTILFELPKLYKKYKDHHEIFVHKFSVNKILQEISQQDLAYTSKINEITASAQGKALTIPAALVAIGALMKIDELIDGTVVIIGMLITSFIVIRSLDVHKATFEHLKGQVGKEFKRYKALSEDAEIRSQSQTTEEQLTGLVSGAAKNVKYAKWGVHLALTCATFYVLIILGYHKTLWQWISNFFTII